jgi:hypothetical protein
LGETREPAPGPRVLGFKHPGPDPGIPGIRGVRVPGPGCILKKKFAQFFATKQACGDFRLETTFHTTHVFLIKWEKSYTEKVAILSST